MQSDKLKVVVAEILLLLRRVRKGNGNSTSAPFTNRQANKIAAAIAMIGEKDKKEDAKFEKGMTRLSLIFVSAKTPAQVGGIIVAPASVVDDAKMAQVAVMLKSIIQKYDKKSKKDEDDEE